LPLETPLFGTLDGFVPLEGTLFGTLDRYLCAVRRNIVWNT
jgi:hypothetical protein